MTRRGLIAGLGLLLDVVGPRPAPVDRRVVRSPWEIIWDTIGWLVIPADSRVIVLGTWREAKAAWIAWDHEGRERRAVVPLADLDWHAPRARRG